VILDPERRGRELGELYRALVSRLFDDLEASGVLPAATDRAAARAEWECFALYACVRGLVAAGGFNRETGQAIDALHDDVMAAWAREPNGESLELRRGRVSERYSEYGAIGQAGGAAGATTVTHRLGEAAARHMAGEPPPEALVETAGALHESLAEGAAEAVRRGT
jgi:hypothetical protein